MYRPFLSQHIVLLLTGILLAVSGCRKGVEAPVQETSLPGKGFNVAVILVDTLRPDHLGCYGYERPTSPNLDALAESGILFEAAHTASTYTGEAVASLFTGVPPAVNPEGLGWSARPVPMEANLPKRLEAAGYKTGIFSTSFVMRFRGFYDSFQESALFPGVANTSALDGELTDAAVEFAKRHQNERMFQYLHYYAPHAPYNPPASFLRTQDLDRTILDPEDDIHPAALVSQGMAENDPRWVELKKHYDAEIMLIDREIERFLSGLRELGLDKKTVVVVLSDHGEEFMEHGFADHAWNLYQETLRIPLIVWAPALFSPARISDPVSIVDVMPTLLECLQVPHETPSMDVGGQALFRPGDSHWEYKTRTGPIYASLFPETRAQLHAVLFDEYKYVAGPRWLTAQDCRRFWLLQGTMAKAARQDDFLPLNPWLAPENEVLFNLEHDPGETRNVASEEKEALARGRALLDSYMKASTSVRGPMTDVTDADPFNDLVVEELLNEIAEDADNAEPGDHGGERLNPEVIEGLETMGYF